MKAKTNAKFLVISGKPINEEIARGGPFVMNTKAEILQAVQDYHNGTFVKNESSNNFKKWWTRSFRT